MLIRLENVTNLSLKTLDFTHPQSDRLKFKTPKWRKTFAHWLMFMSQRSKETGVYVKTARSSSCSLLKIAGRIHKVVWTMFYEPMKLIWNFMFGEKEQRPHSSMKTAIVIVLLWFGFILPQLCKNSCPWLMEQDILKYYSYSKDDVCELNLTSRLCSKTVTLSTSVVLPKKNNNGVLEQPSQSPDLKPAEMLLNVLKWAVHVWKPTISKMNVFWSNFWPFWSEWVKILPHWCAGLISSYCGTSWLHQILKQSFSCLFFLTYLWESM